MTRIVIHADDVGMCHGANAAFVELSASGVISAGSVMAPCPWFPEIAAIAADDPTLDVGVHLTLNAEQAEASVQAARAFGVSDELRSRSTA